MLPSFWPLQFSNRPNFLFNARKLSHFSTRDSSFTYLTTLAPGEQGWHSEESTRLPPMCPGFNSQTRRHMWIEFVVGSCPCSEGFSPGSPVFLPPQKPTFLNSNSIGNSRATGLSVEYLDCCVSPSLNKVDYRYTCTSLYMLNTGIKLLYTLLSLFHLIISILFCKIITCA